MKTKAVKTRSWVRLIAKLLLLAVIAVAVAVPTLTIRDFCDHVKKFNFYLQMGDSVGTEEELGQLHYFYALSAKWRIQWLADRYLFTDAFFYEVADTYLTENWEEVRNKLKDKQEDPRSFLYGIAKFRQAQVQYRATHKIEAPLDFVMTEVRQDFERDLRNCLKVSEYLECFDRVWNYDISGNKKDAQEAIIQPGNTPPEFILGPIKEKDDGPGEPPGKFPARSKQDEKHPGGGGPQRRP
ncbi:MAG: hypothetical protein A2651_00150 [Candidatus Yanofskybacteria bacterium RIFCSPHIGHO2_01_FULL_42_12]|uniref:Uncharacterized protein n=1 Tax=Candidatus Yanofskybacteria bacterium RIFCSPLOWO2_01_FULL_42_49 TaxID=1802694 RepID=A0A1F8GDB3_9BACT|nr:MAG: hypothetical protein A2651_00150 [Candidatus Yanofskybacteria bacterium RIFCSPHIGHO2_01_FULL_42_12]OGN23020.1 MAG: hypothetical protein A2918_02720 [Candidatus Yanofskybacteria bacterium RIFCSPLOWO2_01_FULL_42_49]